MTLYRHYKNKPYRLLDVVKHSESLEDLVLYETLYDNPLGKLWVRPKSMFFETIEHNGTAQPRFAPVQIVLQSASVLSADMRNHISVIAERCFDSWNESDFDSRLQEYDRFHISLAFLDGQAVGFKMGYAIGPDHFYSWLGAVIPEWQRSGVAKTLMEAQHAWCIAQGFKSVRTKCLNFNQAMLILNTKYGFLVYDTEITEQGLKLILEKRLIEPAGV